MWWSNGKHSLIVKEITSSENLLKMMKAKNDPYSSLF